ncbi:cytochrome b/b6 domain-containing protein [Sulfitobacter sp. S190]|uniref:cytochrome b/b6 domain-containing protein n=1 Tax=Sulfitobacter sp. S190 TaxID=2867022 RepID=UPI0021A7FB93|nr:cytochrome b/b6 domain-containing protein [Sulfitobacter sp. S190]UWR21058.1 cytochrome b/b6 domain-containing protein [Sulfitobacter sp. S190]
MPLSNTTTRYGSVTKGFHWLTALLVLTLIPVAVIANRLPYDTSEQLAQKAWLFSLHKTLGVTVFFVALLRIVWAVGQPKPALLNADRKLESFVAEAAHWLLYGSLVLAPLSGWIHHAATSGFAPIWWPFGQSLPLVPKSESVAGVFGGLHWVFTKVMVVTILAHIAGALKHHLVDRDSTLRRMLPGQATLPPLSAADHSKGPLAGALAVWALALGLGWALGVYAPHGETVAAAELAEVASDWEVQEGEIAITVTQLGSEVTGSFDSWTSAIAFDPTIDTGKMGSVETQIAIGSLTLGSVTAQALGPDFFNAQAFETATYSGDIFKAPDDYEVRGTLTIKDTSVPLTLPFQLTLDGETADMQGRLTLDRRDFGIGDNMTDESSLAYAVDVRIALQATRAP